MRTEWDYSKLADAYLERPNYASDVLEEIFRIAGLKDGDYVCDIGAGVAHLTIPMANKGYVVDAVEPNDAMRENGTKRTLKFTNVKWFEGTGEETGRPSHSYDFVSFGSSFNVCDREKALQETHRLLKIGKWFTCMWNHRNLNDSIQATIENIIREYIPNYGYGSRREDQTDIILKSGIFKNIQKIEGNIEHVQSIDKVVEAWRSHATLERQANDKFDEIITVIDKYLKSLGVKEINIPYTTRAWIAQSK